MSRTRTFNLVACSAAALLSVVPLAAASAGTRTPAARSAAAAGAVLGGTTSQDFPVVIEPRSNRRQIVRAVIGISLGCTSGGEVAMPDFYTNLKVNKRGKFSAAYGPQTVRGNDGTTSDFEGTLSGKLNAARTKASGKWHLKVTYFSAAGAVTDTCSGSVTWKAKQ